MNNFWKIFIKPSSIFLIFVPLYMSNAIANSPPAGTYAPHASESSIGVAPSEYAQAIYRSVSIPHDNGKQFGFTIKLDDNSNVLSVTNILSSQGSSDDQPGFAQPAYANFVMTVRRDQIAAAQSNWNPRASCSTINEGKRQKITCAYPTPLVQGTNYTISAEDLTAARTDNEGHDAVPYRIFGFYITNEKTNEKFLFNAIAIKNSRGLISPPGAQTVDSN